MVLNFVEHGIFRANLAHTTSRCLGVFDFQVVFLAMPYPTKWVLFAEHSQTSASCGLFGFAVIHDPPYPQSSQGRSFDGGGGQSRVSSEVKELTWPTNFAPGKLNFDTPNLKTNFIEAPVAKRLHFCSSG